MSKPGELLPKMQLVHPKMTGPKPNLHLSKYDLS